MSVHPRAGQPAQRSDLVDVPRLITSYYAVHPDPDDPAQQVAFGTSGHRGTSLAGTFNEAHVVAITQAICDYRRQAGTNGRWRYFPSLDLFAVVNAYDQDAYVLRLP